MIRRLAVLLLLCVPVAAQTTSLTVTVTDSTSQVWANGTYSISFFPVPNFPNNYQWQGAKFVPQTYSGSMDGTGTFTVTLPDNNTITPSGTQWSFVVCPNATASCTTITTPVTGSSENLSSLFSSRVVPPIITAAPMPRAYSSSEVTNPPGLQGGQFYQVTNNIPYFWSGAQWINLGGTVTSVALSMPSALFSSCSPTITTSGTIICTFASQSANTVFAGPSSGSSAVPSFRSLVPADIPQNIVALAPNPNTPTIAFSNGASGALLGNDGAGVISVSTGTTTGGIIATITFAGTYSQVMWCVISQGSNGTSFFNGQIEPISGLFDPPRWEINYSPGASGEGRIFYWCHE